MIHPKLLLSIASVLAATILSPVDGSAQQKFPLQSGEWAATLSTPGPDGKPSVLLYCLTDATWDKALIHNPACSTQNLQLTASGASYSMECSHGGVQRKGTVSIVFDGKQHMTTKDSIVTISNGQTSSRNYSVDYRWKGPTCTANDVNQ